MLPISAGVEPATSWNPVGRRIQLSHRGRLHEMSKPVFWENKKNILKCHVLTCLSRVLSRARENRKNSRSGPKLRILDRFQTPQNSNKSVQQVCVLNPIFPQPTNFLESMMSKKSQTVKSSQTDNVRAPFKCDIMVVKML